MNELVELFLELSPEQQDEVISWIKERLPMTESLPTERIE